MAGYWLKLYTEIIDDPKYSRLSDNGKLGMIELMIVAKKANQEGMLPGIEDIAFYTRRSVDWWIPVFEELTAINYLVAEGQETMIRKFAERQAAVNGAERIRQFRESKHKNDFKKRDSNKGVTFRYGDSETDSETETEKETEAEADLDSDNLISTFSQISGLSIPKDLETKNEWIEILRRFEKNNITFEVMKQACKELAENEYNVTGPASIMKACEIVINKRRAKNIRPDEAGDFSEFFKH